MHCRLHLPASSTCRPHTTGGCHLLQGPLRSHTQKSLPHVAVFQPSHSLGRHAPMSYLVQAGAATAPSQHAAVQGLLAAPDVQRALQ